MAWRPARIVLVACLAGALLLLLADLRGAAPTAALRGAVGAVAGPPERALAWVRTDLGERFGGSAREEARIAELEDELADVRAGAAAAAAGSLQREDLRELAAAAPATGYRTIETRLVARAGPQDQVRSVSLSAGSADGVIPGAPVLAGRGLVGLVDSVAPGTSTVRLVSDASTALAARVAATGERGVFRGTGSAGQFTMLDPLGRMAEGQLIVTVATPDGVVPANLPIGRIAAVTGSAADLTRIAGITPLVDDSTLDRMVVLVPEEGAG